LFGAVESGPIEVYARELGNNIPRSKVFKNYRGGDISLRSRGDKTADIPDAATTSTSTAATSSAVTSSAATTVSSTAMDVTNDTESGAGDTPLCAASVSSAAAVVVVVEPTSECDNTSSEASSEMSVVENENNVGESTEVTPESGSPCGGEGNSQQPSHLQLGATLHTSKDYFLASDETVFVGTKKYSERFTFWQVKT